MNRWQQLGIVLTLFLGVFLFMISMPNFSGSSYLMTWTIASLILVWLPGFGIARIRRGIKNRQ